MSLASAVEPLALGAALGVSFNPLAAVVGSAAAAAAVGVPITRPGRRRWAAGMLLTAWLAGDGVRVLARARELAESVGSESWGTWSPLAVWGVLGLACYLVPALVGAFVGRRVTRGTGWLSAVAVAVTLSLAFSTAAPALVEPLKRLAGA